MAPIQLPAEVQQAKANAQNLLGSATQMKAAEPMVTDVLRQRVQEAYAQNQDIVKPLDEATQTYLGSPQVGREKYQDIFNPFTREKLVSQYTGNKALPMLSYSNIYGNRMGRIEDILGAGVRGYQASADALLGKAQLAQQAYKDALDEYTTLETLRQSAGGGSGDGGDGFNYGGGNTGDDEWEVVEDFQPWDTAYSPTQPSSQFAPSQMSSQMPNQSNGGMNIGGEIYQPTSLTPVKPAQNNVLETIMSWFRPTPKIQLPYNNSSYLPSSQIRL
jgi:hypothetical protein